MPHTAAKLANHRHRSINQIVDYYAESVKLETILFEFAKYSLKMVKIDGK